MRERMSIYQLASRHGRAVSTVYNWHNKGLLPPLHKMGGQSFFYLDEISEWEDSGCRPAGHQRIEEEEKIS